MLGQLLDGRYQIIKALAAGGFGQTYIAQDTKLPGNPQCVVKQLQPTANDPTTLKVAWRLFQSEAQVLQQLGSHPQIPQLLAFFEEKNEFFLVQEFIAGQPLSKEIVPRQQWQEAAVIKLLEEILEPLVFVHQDQVIHRDIKPDNLIRRAIDNRVVLIDFGAVKEIAATQVNTQGLTQLTVTIGTSGYMPSEQAQGKPRFSSDVYAVGMMGIQALTGLLPHELQEEPVTAEILWRDMVQVNAELGEVLEKMVRYDFRQRYPSAEAALQAIQELRQQPQAPTIIPATVARYELTLEWREKGEVRDVVILENQKTKNPGVFRIGRDPNSCDLLLTSPSVSRQQADIWFNPQQKRFYLRSLSESNPPMVNGQVLKRGDMVVNQGSEIKLGQLGLRVKEVVENQSPQQFVSVAPTLPVTPVPQVTTQLPKVSLQQGDSGLKQQSTESFRSSFLHVFNFLLLPYSSVSVIIVLLENFSLEFLPGLGVLFGITLFISLIIFDCYKVFISPKGLKCFDFWGIYHFTGWSSITNAKLYNILWLEYLRVFSSSTPRPLWLPLFLKRKTYFLEKVKEYAGEDHPLTIALKKHI